MKNMLFFILALPSVVCLSGCITPMNTDDQARAVRDRAELAALRTDVDSIKERIAAQEKSVQDLREKFEALKPVMANDNREMAERLAVIEKALKNAETAHDEIKKQIIDDLAGKLEKIGRIQASGTTTASGRSRLHEGTDGSVTKEPKGSGKEHLVRPGETLSSIATLYKVKVQDLMQANNIKDDRIRIGQKIVIPE